MGCLLWNLGDLHLWTIGGRLTKGLKIERPIEITVKDHYSHMLFQSFSQLVKLIESKEKLGTPKYALYDSLVGLTFDW